MKTTMIDNCRGNESSDYYFYYYDFLNNIDDDLMDDNLMLFPNTNAYDECVNLTLRNCFNDSDYDLVIGSNRSFESELNQNLEVSAIFD